MKLLGYFVLSTLICHCVSLLGSADEIYVLGSGHSGINAAVNNLNSLGHVVTTGDPLEDYSGFDQVWDLRFTSDITTADRTAMTNFLQGGGSIFASGENSVFDAPRNNSINAFLSEIGAGSVTLLGNADGYTTQVFTAKGAALNSPNEMAGLTYYYARTVSAASSNGFLVTETSAGSGIGSLVAWDHGDITAAPNARLLVGFDIEICELGGVDFTENLATFMGGSISNSVAPVGITVTLGTSNSGGVPEVSESDDQYLVLDPEFLTFRYQLEFTVNATSPSSAPTALEFSYESRTFNFVGTVDQEIELFNYDTGQFETTDSRLTTSSDTVVSVTPSGDPTRFVEAGTDALWARISYQNSFPFWVFSTENLYLPYRVRADHIFWIITP